MVQRIDLPRHECGKADAKESIPVHRPVSRPWRDLFIGDGPLWMRLLAWASRKARR